MLDITAKFHKIKSFGDEKIRAQGGEVILPSSRSWLAAALGFVPKFFLALKSGVSPIYLQLNYEVLPAMG